MVLEFCLGATAACMAVCVSNPSEVVKTRMQLQGELSASSAASKAYKNFFHAFREIVRNEGFSAVQKGLGCAWLYQICLNGMRMGCYDKFMSLTLPVLGENNRLACNLISGSGAGTLGALAGSPFFLIKTRLQSHYTGKQSTGAAAAVVGEQYNYRGTMDGLRKVYASGGIVGLYQGAGIASLRTAVGSSIQLTTYDYSKRFFMQQLDLPADRFGVHLCASLVTGAAVAVGMNPLDVLMTRIYNTSHRSDKYNHGIAASLRQIVKVEGVAGLYKGVAAHFFRIGPHTICMFVFLEQLRNAARRAELL